MSSWSTSGELVLRRLGFRDPSREVSTLLLSNSSGSVAERAASIAQNTDQATCSPRPFCPYEEISRSSAKGPTLAAPARSPLRAWVPAVAANLRARSACSAPAPGPGPAIAGDLSCAAAVASQAVSQAHLARDNCTHADATVTSRDAAKSSIFDSRDCDRLITLFSSMPA